jgi:protein-tyrosine-phosphatase
MDILFLCTGNSCRSILTEAVFNHLAPTGWHAMSAGNQPTGQVHPRSLALLAREGIATDGYYSKSWDQLPLTPDIVITVCARAAGETCPAYLGARIAQPLGRRRSGPCQRHRCRNRRRFHDRLSAAAQPD